MTHKTAKDFHPEVLKLFDQYVHGVIGESASRVYQAYIYPGVQHGFNNDTTPRYDAAAAQLAWQRTIDFFNQHLRG